MHTRLIATVLFLGLAWAAPQRAEAAPILLTLEGVNDSTLGATVRMAYDPLLGRLTLDVTNTSERWDPRLTSFAFNAPAQITGISLFTSSPAGWDYEYDRNDINTPGKFGFFDVAGVTGSGFNGGSTHLGVRIGQTFTFAFTFTGSGLNTLTEQSFASLLSYDAPGSPNESEQAFIARFQQTGRWGNDSDVAIPTSVTTVPEPSTLVLGGFGLLGLAARGRRHSSMSA